MDHRLSHTLAVYNTRTCIYSMNDYTENVCTCTCMVCVECDNWVHHGNSTLCCVLIGANEVLSTFMGGNHFNGEEEEQGEVRCRGQQDGITFCTATCMVKLNEWVCGVVHHTSTYIYTMYSSCGCRVQTG